MTRSQSHRTQKQKKAKYQEKKRGVIVGKGAAVLNLNLGKNTPKKPRSEGKEKKKEKIATVRPACTTGSWDPKGEGKRGVLLDWSFVSHFSKGGRKKRGRRGL